MTRVKPVKEGWKVYPKLLWVLSTWVLLLSEDLSTVVWRLAILASVICDLVPFTEGTPWWYTLPCTRVGFAWYPVRCCLPSFEILGGCALLTLCGLMPSYIIVRRQGLLWYSGHLDSVMRLSTFQNKGDGNHPNVDNLQNPCFAYYSHDGMPLQALPLAVAICQ